MTNIIAAVSQISTCNVTGLYFLKVKKSFVIVRNEKRFYIGEVLDLYKCAVGNRYGSVEAASKVEELQYLSLRVYLPLTTVCRHYDSKLFLLRILQGAIAEDGDDSGSESEAPLFSCYHGNTYAKIHTHASAEHVLYHLGWAVMQKVSRRTFLLTADATKHWCALTKPAVAKLPTLKIRGGKQKSTTKA